MMIVYWKCKEFGAFQKDTNPIHLWEEEMKLWATIGPHTWTPAGFCVLLVFYDHFFFSPFNPSGQQVNDKTTKIQEYNHWDGWVVLVSLLYLSGLSRKLECLTQRKIQTEENRFHLKIDKKCLDGVSKLNSRFDRFWPIFLW